MPCKVIPVPALQDNYMYLIIDEATKKAGVVDPVDVDAIQKAASENGAIIDCILTTHHHWDHDGGNIKLTEQCTSITEVYGGKGDNADAVTKEVGDGDEFMIGETPVRVLFTPCHTPGHVCYFVGSKHVFTGDTMFISGCGNFNSGTPQQMTDAFDKILSLPDDTSVWVGHEYTHKNCKFAHFAEPANEEAKARLEWAASQGSMHSGGQGTIPSTISDEKKCNPFARIDAQDIIKFCGDASDRAERMRLVRKGKDDWGVKTNL